MARLKRKFGRYRRFSPKKGTKARGLLLMALRPKGVTAQEAIDEVGVSYKSFHSVLVTLEREYGYDIRGARKNKAATVYKLHGRFYDRYRKNKSFSSITNKQILKLQKDNRISREDAKRLKLLREVGVVDAPLTDKKGEDII